MVHRQSIRLSMYSVLEQSLTCSLRLLTYRTRRGSLQTSFSGTWAVLNKTSLILYTGQVTGFSLVSSLMLRMFLPVLLPASPPATLAMTATSLLGDESKVWKNFTYLLIIWDLMLGYPQARRLSTKYPCVLLGRSQTSLVHVFQHR